MTDHIEITTNDLRRFQCHVSRSIFGKSWQWIIVEEHELGVTSFVGRSKKRMRSERLAFADAMAAFWLKLNQPPPADLPAALGTPGETT